MSSPRDRDGFDEHRSGEWQEPEHLGSGNSPDGPAQPSADRPPAESPSADGRQAGPPPADPPGATAWQPPGWDLPTVEPDRPSTAGRATGGPTVGPETGGTTPAGASGSGRAEPDADRWDAPAADPREPDVPPPGRFPSPAGERGLFGSRRPRTPGAAEQVFRSETDPLGVQAWALHHGWVPSDGTGPQDAPLAELVRSAPVRATKDHRPGNVVRGRGMGLDLVAFDVVYASGRYLLPQWAVTAAPVLREVPGFRLSPARLWRHRTGGLLQIPSGDPEFDTRWLMLATADAPQVRRVVEDPVVRQLLLGTDDGDELWSAAGFVAAVRPDGHRPQLIEHHARLLAVVVGALATAS